MKLLCFLFSDSSQNTKRLTVKRTEKICDDGAVVTISEIKKPRKVMFNEDVEENVIENIRPVEKTKSQAVTVRHTPQADEVNECKSQ